MNYVVTSSSQTSSVQTGSVQTGSGDLPASCPMDTMSPIPRAKAQL